MEARELKASNAPPIRTGEVAGPGAAFGGLGLPSRPLVWLRGWRGVLLGAALLAIGGAAVGWPWLVAIGIAPILLSIAPCVAMCALGVCVICKGTNSTEPPPGPNS